MAKSALKAAPARGTKRDETRARGAPRRRAADNGSELAKVAGLLGGRAVLRRQVVTRLDAHEAVAEGIRGEAVLHVLREIEALGRGDVASALGMSMRTLQRLTPDKALSVEQSSRAWKFAEVVEHASRVFGSKVAAEQWLSRPAMALDQQIPIELMKTSVGTDLVEELLGRLEHGVYT